MCAPTDAVVDNIARQNASRNSNSFASDFSWFKLFLNLMSLINLIFLYILCYHVNVMRFYEAKCQNNFVLIGLELASGCLIDEARKGMSAAVCRLYFRDLILSGVEYMHLICLPRYQKRKFVDQPKWATENRRFRKSSDWPLIFYRVRWSKACAVLCSTWLRKCTLVCTICDRPIFGPVE